MRSLKEHDFTVLRFEWDFGKTSSGYICVKDEVLEEIKIIRGPPLDSEKHCLAFKTKHEDVFEEEGFLFSKQKRKFVKAYDLIKSLLKDAYIKERCDAVSFNVIKKKH